MALTEQLPNRLGSEWIRMGGSGSPTNLVARCVLTDLLVGDWRRAQVMERNRAAQERRAPKRIPNLATALPGFGQILVGGSAVPAFDTPAVERVLGGEDLNGAEIGGFLMITVANLGPDAADFMMARSREAEPDRVVVVTTDESGYQRFLALITLKEEQLSQAFSKK